MPKIAILGNMNNNHFSLMRYMRDLGLDAYLLLYVNEISHFMPECDSWDIKKWEPYIIQTELTNGANWTSTLKLPFRRKAIQRVFEPFEVVIANGFGPAYLYLAGRPLDIWVPYGLGGEFLIKESKMGLFGNFFFKIRKTLQVRGLRNTNHIITVDNSDQNLIHYKEFGLESKIVNLLIPMVYVEKEPQIKQRPEVEKVAQQIKSSRRSLFCHVSHFWKSVRPFEGDMAIKKNDVLIRAFSHYYHQSEKRDFKLFLFDYGPDVKHSRELIDSLDISEAVYWCPVMSRKEILYLISQVDLGCGELGGYIWGGTGYEFLSHNVPFFQYVIDEQVNAFKNMVGAFPPILNHGNDTDIGECLLELEDEPVKINEWAASLKDWFDEHATHGLAKSYADILNIECPALSE